MKPYLRDAVLRHLRTPGTTRDLQMRMRTSEASAAHLVRYYRSRGDLVVVGKKQTAPVGRPAKVYQAAR